MKNNVPIALWGGRMSLILAATVLLVLVSSPWGDAQDKPEATIGRYDTVLWPQEFGMEEIVMIDTTTGECWGPGRGGWFDLKFPFKDTKVTKGACGRFRFRVLCSYGKNGPKAEKLVVWDTVNGRSWWCEDILKDDVRWNALLPPRSK